MNAANQSYINLPALTSTRPRGILCERMKIYTKTGDSGETGLLGGRRVGKDTPLIDACGAVDELCAALGVAMASSENLQINGILARIQQELFVLGADLATPPGDGNVSKVAGGAPRIAGGYTQRLEKEIDGFTAQVGELGHFILPGGSQAGAAIHLARAVCRRAERAVVHAARTEPLSPEALRYINRLSDHLFALARFANRLAEQPETIWSRESVERDSHSS